VPAGRSRQLARHRCTSFGYAPGATVFPWRCSPAQARELDAGARAVHRRWAAPFSAHRTRSRARRLMMSFYSPTRSGSARWPGRDGDQLLRGTPGYAPIPSAERTVGPDAIGARNKSRRVLFPSAAKATVALSVSIPPSGSKHGSPHLALS
jgi:hypothetical protein